MDKTLKRLFMVVGIIACILVIVFVSYIGITTILEKNELRILENQASELKQQIYTKENEATALLGQSIFLFNDRNAYDLNQKEMNKKKSEANDLRLQLEIIESKLKRLQ